VDAVYIVGEMALPFIVLLADGKFPDLENKGLQYNSLCRLLLAKARLCGYTLLFPQDILIGEEPLKTEDKLKSYTNIVTESRSEGADYEGETKNITLSSLTAESLTFGYYYDVGSETSKHFSSVASSYDLVFVWGTTGISEINNFQSGQQALVQAFALKPSSEEQKQVAAGSNADAGVSQLPLKHIVVWGDSTVEWFARFLDSDGELNGNLVGGGFLTFQNRDSSILRAVLSYHASDVMEKGLTYREPVAGEWIYSTRIVEVEEEDEEEY
jgi:hypothetical protein